MSGTGETVEDGGLRGAVESAIEATEAAAVESPLAASLTAPAAVEKPDENVTVDAPAPVEDVETAPKDEKSLEPHASWSKEIKDSFSKLPPEGKQIVLERERSMQADYTKKTQEIAALRRDYEPVDKMFTPYRDQMKATGQTPASLIEGWANVEKALMGGKGIDVIRGIVQGYKLDPQAIIAALGPQQQQQVDPNVQRQPAQSFQLPPEIQAKLSKIDQFESRFAADDQARQNAEIAKVSQSIEDFKSAKDAQGNAKHPHFDELEADMATMAQVVRAQGKNPDLQALYESAVYANPSTRAKVLAAEKQADEKRVKDEARAKAEKARKASSSVTGSPSNGSGQPLANGRDDKMSLRDQIAQSYSEVGS